MVNVQKKQKHKFFGQPFAKAFEKAFNRFPIIICYNHSSLSIDSVKGRERDKSNTVMSKMISTNPLQKKVINGIEIARQVKLL
jgi:hypothetical protein